MPTITLTNPVALTPGVASLHATNMTILQNLLNAGLDSANFASGLIFPSTQLMQVSADTRHVIGWDGTNWAPRLMPKRFADNLLSSDAASIDFTGLPQTHQGLLIICYLRATSAGTVTNAYIRFNGDSGANYDIQQLAGSAATASAFETFATNGIQTPITQASAAANVFLPTVMHVPNYANSTNNKTVSYQNGQKIGTSSGNLAAVIRSGMWRSSAAINQVTVLDSAGGNLLAGSRVTIWGMP